MSDFCLRPGPAVAPTFTPVCMLPSGHSGTCNWADRTRLRNEAIAAAAGERSAKRSGARPVVLDAGAPRIVALDARVAAEVRRQDAVSTYGTDRDGVRLALACLQDEVAEALDAFQRDKRPIEGRTWQQTQDEVVQAVAIGLRLLRDLAAERA